MNSPFHRNPQPVRLHSTIKMQCYYLFKKLFHTVTVTSTRGPRQMNFFEINVTLWNLMIELILGVWANNKRVTFCVENIDRDRARARERERKLASALGDDPVPRCLTVGPGGRPFRLHCAYREILFGVISVASRRSS